MFSSDNTADRLTVAAISTVGGITVGATLASVIAWYIHQSKITEEKRYRDILPTDELIQNRGKENEFDVTKIYERILEENLYPVIVDEYKQKRCENFIESVKKLALPQQLENTSESFIPSIGKALNENNEINESGVYETLFDLFKEYKGKDKMDVYIAMMQVLENILILYKGFLVENLVAGEDESEKIKKINLAMINVVSTLANSPMFEHRDFRYAVWKTDREITLPKIINLLENIGKETIEIQQNLAIAKQGKEKQSAINKATLGIEEFFDRLGSKDTYQTDRYNMYLRKDGILKYTTNSIQNSMNDPDDLVPNIIKKHISNTYAVFKAPKIQSPKHSEFSYFNYLMNVTNENLREENSRKALLPRIATMTTDKFSKPLQSKDVESVASDIEECLKFFNIAQAMQADLNKRLDDYGWVNLCLTHEFQYRQKLIDIFLERAIEIAKDDILIENGYFEQCLARTNDHQFINTAKNEDKSYLAIGKDRISNADKNTLINSSSTINEHFNVPLNNMAHAKALSNTSIQLDNIKKIDKEWENLPKRASMNAAREGIQYTGSKRINISNEYLINIAFATQYDEKIQTALKQLNKIGDSKLNEYIDTLNEIKNTKFEFKIKETGTGYLAGMGVVKKTAYSISSDNRQNVVITPKALSDLQEFFAEYQLGFAKSAQPNLLLFEFTSEKLKLNIPTFHNKESINKFKNDLDYFTNKFNKFLEDFPNNGFSSAIKAKCEALTYQLDSLNNGIDTSEIEFERIEREQEKHKNNQVLSEIEARLKIKMQELTKYQEEVNSIIDTLFKENREVFEKLATSIKEKHANTDKILNEEKKTINELVNTTFSDIQKNIETIANQHTEINQLNENANKLASESNQISSQSNQAPLDQNLILIEKLKEMGPKIISEILNSVKTVHQKIIDDLQSKNTLLETEKTEINNKLEESKKLNAEMISEIAEIKECNTTVTEKLNLVSEELSRQTETITNVDNKLRTLSATVKSIIEKFNQTDIAASINAFEEDIKALNMTNIDQADTERIKRISENYIKSRPIIDFAVTLVQKITVDIDDIIKTNNLSKNSNEAMASNTREALDILLIEQRRINELEETAKKYIVAYDNILKRYVESLEKDKIANENRTRQIQEMSKNLNDAHQKLTQLHEKEISELTTKNESLLLENSTQKTTIINLENKISGLQINRANLESEYGNSLNNLTTNADSSQKKISNNLTMFGNHVTKELGSIKSVLEASENLISDNHKRASSDMDDAHSSLEQIQFDVSNMVETVSGNNILPTYDDPILKLRNLCTDFAITINSDYKTRLENEWFSKFGDEDYTGTQKHKWMTALKTKMVPGVSDDDFFETFRALLLIYFQNKDGNGAFNLKKTTIGKSVIELMNEPEYLDIRLQLFGSSKDLSYEKLAGKLKDVSNTAKNIALEEINKNNPREKLTIKQFGKVDNSLAKISDTLRLHKFDFKKHTKHNNKLLAEKDRMFKTVDPTQQANYNPFDNMMKPTPR